MAEYIERDVALKEANGFPFICLSEQESVGMQRAQAIIAKRIEALPAADVHPVVRGRWLCVVQAVVDTTGVCSNCCEEAVWRTRKKPYAICPNCGAMMEVQDGWQKAT